MRKDVNQRERAAADRRVRGSGPTRRKRRKHKRNLILYYILFFIIFAATAAVLSLTVLFKVQGVTVTGSSKYSSEDLVKSAGVAIGDNLIRIDKQEITENLVKYPYVEDVEVRRDFPPSVYITVTEARPIAALSSGEAYILISAKGRVLETAAADKGDAPLVTGLDAAGVPAGEYISEEQQENLLMLKYLIAAIDATGFEGINLIDISDRLNLIATYDNRIIMELGSEGNLEYKLRFASEVIADQLEEGFEGIIDLSIYKQLRARPTDVHKIYPQLEGGTQHTLPEIPEDLEEESEAEVPKNDSSGAANE